MNGQQSARERLESVVLRIHHACMRAGRPDDAVTLLAVGKTFGADAIRQLVAAGQRAFGENYLQEALRKQAELADLDIEWHFIGPIQSNKTRAIAESFAWVHTVDRLKIASRLSTQRPAHLAPLNICVQVNIDNETTKNGCDRDETVALAREIAQLPRVALRGLMAIPAQGEAGAPPSEAFHDMATIADQVRAELEPDQARHFDTLSMGMSGDLEAAIVEGATIVRVGTALFGQRPVRV